MPIVVAGPDGGTVSFPDGTDDATISHVMAQTYGSKGQAPANSAPPPGPGANAGGQPAQPAGQGTPSVAPTNDIGLGLEAGLKLPLDNAAVYASKIPIIGPALDQLGGPGGTAEAVLARDRAYLDQQRQQGRVPDPVAQFGGNVAATLPIAAVTKNPWLAGAAGGALTTKDPNDLVGSAIDTGAGAIGGKATQVGLNLAGNVINPLVRPAVQRLIQQGVRVTPGGILGGVTQLTENASKYLPVIGDLVYGAQDRALTDFNNAAYNAALKDIGQKLPPNITGHEAAEFTQKAISAQYQKIYPTLRVQADGQFRTDTADLANEIKNGGLPAEKQQQFMQYMQGIGRRFSGAGGMTGRTAGDVDQILGAEYAKYRKSPLPDDQKYASYLLQAQDNFRQMVIRANPGRAAELAGMRSAWSKFVPVENAAGGAGTDELGRFQPGQLKASIAQNVPIRPMAQGHARQQGLAEDAQGVLGRSVTKPSSLNRLMTGGGLGLLGLAAHIDPFGLAPALVAAAPYTRTGQRVMQSMLTGRQGPGAQAAAAVPRALARTGLPGVIGGVAAPKRKPYTPAPPDEVDLGVTGR